MKSAFFAILFLFAASLILIAADTAPDVEVDIAAATAEVEKVLSSIEIAPASIDFVSPAQTAIGNAADHDEVPLADQNIWHTHQYVAIEASDWDSVQFTLKIEPSTEVDYASAITWTKDGVTEEDFATLQLRLDARWAKRTAQAYGEFDSRKPLPANDDTAVSADQVGPPTAKLDIVATD